MLVPLTPSPQNPVQEGMQLPADNSTANESAQPFCLREALKIRLAWKSQAGCVRAAFPNKQLSLLYRATDIGQMNQKGVRNQGSASPTGCLLATGWWLIHQARLRLGPMWYFGFFILSLRKK